MPRPDQFRPADGPMVGLHAVQRWLSRITYKPDTSFEAYADFGQVTIHIRRLLPDSTRQLKTLGEYADAAAFIVVGIDIPVNLGRFERLPQEHQFEAFHHWLHEELYRLERHELDEWFRIDGKLPYDPHAMDRIA